MLSIYYRIWADAIAYEQSKRGEDAKDWRLLTIVYLSALMGMNLLVILYLLKLLSGGTMPILLPFRIFNAYGFNSVLEVLATFLIPFVILNYLLIFNGDKYQKILNQYGNKKGKLLRNYALISVGLIIIPIVFKFVFVDII